MSRVDTTGIKASDFRTKATLQPVRAASNLPTKGIKVADRAATRQAIIVTLRKRGYNFATRSDWHAAAPRKALVPDWDYAQIAIHHAGNSFSCPAAGDEQMRAAQAKEMSGRFDDVSYHYAVDCNGTIYEARDIRFKGAHVDQGNTGIIGIVLLADLSVRGESWEEEYRNAPWLRKIWGAKDWISDKLDAGNDESTDAQLKSLFALVQVLKTYFRVATLGGHREFQKKATSEGRACPGTYGMAIVQLLREKHGFAAP